MVFRGEREVRFLSFLKEDPKTGKVEKKPLKRDQASCVATFAHACNSVWDAEQSILDGSLDVEDGATRLVVPLSLSLSLSALKALGAPRALGPILILREPSPGSQSFVLNRLELFAYNHPVVFTRL